MGCRIIWKFVVHPEPSKTFPSDSINEREENNKQRDSERKSFIAKSQNERPGTGRCNFLQQNASRSCEKLRLNP